MTSNRLACLAAAVMLTAAMTTHAQSSDPGAQNSSSSPTAAGPMNSDEAARQVTTPGTLTDGDPNHSQLLLHHGSEISLGWRLWAFSILSPIVGLFVHIEPGWGGTLGAATGPELVYRTESGMDVDLSLMYVGYSAGPGYFRGTNQDVVDTQQITSYLYGAFFTAHMLWPIHFGRIFELQIGIGLGIGYVGGDLYRSQAYQDASGWHDCGTMRNGPGGYCAVTSDHVFQQKDRSFLDGGNIPTVFPWISLPHVAFHIRPARHFDIKLEGGFALIGVYGGGSLHYVF